MRYTSLMTIALLLAAGTAAADGPRHGGDRGPDIDRLAIVLDLDDYQKQQVEQIMNEHHEAAMAKREAFRAAGERPDRETMEAEREAMRAKLRGRLETVLTPEQLVKLDALHEMRQERHERHGHRDRKHGHAPDEEPAADGS